jgi:hypothetical protein
MYRLQIWGKIESWVHGKLEFKYFVISSNGTKIKEKGFGKWARKYFKDRKWKDFSDFLAYWNRANIGDYQVEAWIEEDGGQSNSYSISMPAQNGAPGYSVNVPSHDRDDKLGQSIVQFTDPLATVYGITYMNFKRKFLIIVVKIS